MTPAVTALQRSGVKHAIHRYSARAGDEQTYGEAVAEALGVPPDRLFKTLVAQLDTNELVIALVPVSQSLDLRALAAVAGAKTATMAAPGEAERATGYVTGGISPLGQRKRLRTFVDVSARAHGTIYCSAGRRGLQLEVSPIDLLTLTSAHEAVLGRHGPS